MTRAQQSGVTSSVQSIRCVRPRQKARRLREALLHAWVRGLARVMYRLRTVGLDRVPSGPAVLVCNHVSFVDALIIGGSFRRPVRFVMDHSFYRGPLRRWLLDAAGVIPIARAKDDPDRLRRAYDRIAENLAHGELVCIFPEGMITHDGALNPFRDGVLRIIERTPAPVVPLAINGMWGSFFSRARGRAMRQLPRRFRARVELRGSAPIPPAAVSTERIRHDVESMLEAVDR